MPKTAGAGLRLQARGDQRTTAHQAQPGRRQGHHPRPQRGLPTVRRGRARAHRLAPALVGAAPAGGAEGAVPTPLPGVQAGVCHTEQGGELV